MRVPAEADDPIPEDLNLLLQLLNLAAIRHGCHNAHTRQPVRPQLAGPPGHVRPCKQAS
jgi:hypothetical protein